MKFLTLFLVFLTACTPVLTLKAVPTQTSTPPPNAVPAPPNALGETPNALGSAEVTANSLHVRAAPMGLILGYLFHGDVIQLSGKCQTGWAQIEWDGGRAWVRAKWLSENICKEGE